MNIKKYISLYRNQLTYREFTKAILTWLIWFCLLLLSLSILETIFYLSSWKRQKIYFILFLSFFGPLLYIFLRYIIRKNSFFNNLNEEKIATDIGRHDKKLQDKLKNHLQLLNHLKKIKKGKDLAQFSIQRIERYLDNKSQINHFKVNTKF